MTAETGSSPSGETQAPARVVPEGIVEPRRTPGGVVWVVPLAALVVTLLVGWRAWQARGVSVEIEFAEAHGLREGDPVRSHGVDVGVVRAVTLEGEVAADPSVQVLLRIDRDAADLLRAGSRFWIQRPQVDFDGIEGLDTLAGSRWVGLEPGSGEGFRGPFRGLDEPPIELGPGDDGLEIVLEATARWGMRPGGAVTYRGVGIGTITDLDLAADARRVEARVRIEPRYAGLVRVGTRFFATSGIGLELGLRGFRADIDSLESIITGGVGFATPPDAGPRAVTGARFELAERPEPAWLEWAPGLAVGLNGAPEPDRRRVVLRFRSGLLGREKTRSGWALILPGVGVTLPVALLAPPNDAKDAILELDGTSLPLDELGASIDARRVASGPPIGWLPASTVPVPPGSRVLEPADGLPKSGTTLLLWTDPGGEPLPIPGHRWRVDDGGIVIEPGVGLTDEDLGGPIVEGLENRLLGILAIENGSWRVSVLDLSE